MTVLYGYVKSTPDGYQFEGKFGPIRGGKPEFSIQGGFTNPVEDFLVPFAELSNAKEGHYPLDGDIGPGILYLHSNSSPQITLYGKLSATVRPIRVNGWFLIRPIVD